MKLLHTIKKELNGARLDIQGVEDDGRIEISIKLNNEIIYVIQLHIERNYIIDLLNFAFAAAVLKLNNKILDKFFITYQFTKKDINTLKFAAL